MERNVTDQVMKKNVPAAVDGFDGFEDSDQEQFARVIQGLKLQFANDGTWVCDEEEIPPSREVVVVDVARVVQKWLHERPVETRFLAPGEKLPDLQQLNEACPRSEWTEDLSGKPRGPWQFCSCVYLVDLLTMQRFTFPTSTIGGGICVQELIGAVKMMRKFRGRNVFPVVSMASKPMKTRFGGRQ
jgi:hypothetical protein